MVCMYSLLPKNMRVFHYKMLFFNDLHNVCIQTLKTTWLHKQKHFGIEPKQRTTVHLFCK